MVEQVVLCYRVAAEPVFDSLDGVGVGHVEGTGGFVVVGLFAVVSARRRECGLMRCS